MIDTEKNVAEKQGSSAKGQGSAGRNTALVLFIVGAFVVTVLLYLSGVHSQQSKGKTPLNNGTYVASSSSSSVGNVNGDTTTVSGVTTGTFVATNDTDVPEAFKVTGSMNSATTPTSSDKAQSSARASYYAQYKDRTKIAVGGEDSEGNQEVIVDYKVTEKESVETMHFYLDYSRATFIPEYATIISPSGVEYPASFLNANKNGEIYFVISKPEVGTWKAYFAPGKYGACISGFLTQAQYEIVSRPMSDSDIPSRTLDDGVVVSNKTSTSAGSSASRTSSSRAVTSSASSSASSAQGLAPYVW